MQRKRIPLRYQVEDSLRIELESLGYSEKIPSEDDLAVKFGVSRGTIRQAIIELINQGLLYRVHGKGTFKSGVALFNSGYMITSLTEQLIQSGFSPGIKDIIVTSEMPSVKVCNRLLIQNDEPIWKINRVRLADGKPISSNSAYIRKSLIPDLSPSDLEMSFIVMITEKFKIRLVKTENYCSATLAGPSLSEKLLISINSPILHVEQIAYGIEDKPIYLDISEAIGDQQYLRFEQRGV